MDCIRAKEQINMYVDDMLGDAETNALLAHVSSCASCQKDMDETLALKHALGGFEEQTPPLGLASSAIHRAKKSRVPAIAFISAGVAAAVAVVAITVGVLSGGPPQRLGDTLASADESSKVGNAALYENGVNDAAESDAQMAMTMDTDLAEDTVMQESAAGDMADAPMTATDDTADGVADDAAPAELDYCFITVPPENAAFFDTLYTFVTEAGIEKQQYELEFGSMMSFVIDDENFEAFISMLNEEEIAFEGVLYPGCYVEVSYIEQ